MEEEDPVEAFREVNLSDGNCNVSLYVCAKEEKKIDDDPEYASEVFKAALEGRLPAASDDSESCGASDSENGTDDVDEKKKEEDQIKESEENFVWQLLEVVKKHSNIIPLHNGKWKPFLTKVCADMSAKGCNLTMKFIRDKFNSLVNTYKSFKTLDDGRSKIKWEYFDVVDEIIKSLEVNHKNGKWRNNIGFGMTDKDLSDTELEPNSMDSLFIENPPDNKTSSPKRIKNSTVLQESSSNSTKKVTWNKRLKRSSTKSQPAPASKKQKRKKVESEDDPRDDIKKEEQYDKNCNFLPQDECQTTDQGELKNELQHVIVGCAGFSHPATRQFIECIKKHKDMLKLKKSLEMFSIIKCEMALEGFSFTEDELRRKWYNLLISYRRILERANETGQVLTGWPYYQAMDSIIVDRKVLSEKMKNSNASTSKMSKSRSQGNKDSTVESLDNSLGQSSQKDQQRMVYDVIRSGDQWCNSHTEENGEFQRNFLKAWEQREMRREERDLLKLDILKKIAKSIEDMTRKQDILLNMMKKLK